MKNKRIFLFFILLLLFSIPSSSIYSAQETATDLIFLINNVRNNDGLPELVVNSSLSAAAQMQADYLASQYGSEFSTIEDWHSGPDDGDAYNRAVIAGYDLGPGWIVDEITYAGSDSSTSNDALSSWLDSTEDAYAIYSTESFDIGAGISSGDGFTYYVVVFSVELGSGSSPNKGVSSTIPSLAATPEVAHVNVATPGEDGSLFHTVESGDALWSIAIAYDTTIEQILALNGLDEDAVIYEGQPLQVRPAFTPTPRPTETNTPLPPTRTPIPAQTAKAINTPIPTQAEEAEGFLGMDNQTMGLALILISGVGLIMIVGGYLAKDKASKKKTD